MGINDDLTRQVQSDAAKLYHQMQKAPGSVPQAGGGRPAGIMSQMGYYPPAPNPETSGNGWLGTAKDAFDAGFAGVFSGIAGVPGQNAVSDYFDEIVQANQRNKEWDTIFDPEYWTDKEGAWYDLLNQLGSMFALAPAGFLLPESTAAGAGALIAGQAIKTASKVGAKRVAQKLAKAAISKGGQQALTTGVRGAATAIPESLSEMGSVSKELEAQGDEHNVLNSLPVFAKNMATLPVSNALEWMLLGGELFNPTAKVGEGLAARVAKAPFRSAPSMAASATQQGLEELFQQTYTDQALGNPVGNPLNPAEWTKEQRNAFEVGAMGGGILSGLGSMTRASMPNKQGQQQEQQQERLMLPAPQKQLMAPPPAPEAPAPEGPAVNPNQPPRFNPNNQDPLYGNDINEFIGSVPSWDDEELVYAYNVLSRFPNDDPLKQAVISMIQKRNLHVTPGPNSAYMQDKDDTGRALVPKLGNIRPAGDYGQPAQDMRNRYNTEMAGAEKPADYRPNDYTHAAVHTDDKHVASLSDKKLVDLAKKMERVSNDNPFKQTVLNELRNRPGVGVSEGFTTRGANDVMAGSSKPFTLTKEFKDRIIERYAGKPEELSKAVQQAVKVINQMPIDNNLRNSYINTVQEIYNATAEAVKTGAPVKPQKVSTPKGRAEKLSSRPAGGQSEVVTDDGTAFNVRYKLMDADDLVTSNNPKDFTPNKNYPQELQPRNRQSDMLQKQVRRMTAELRPADLAESRNINNGAPIINKDGIVENGNGRTMAITRALKGAVNGGTKTGKAYRQFLKDNASRYGFTPEQVDSVKNPILVRERIDDVEEAKITSSTAGGANLGATEQGVDDSKRLSAGTLGSFKPNSDGSLLTAENKEFLKGALTDITNDNPAVLNSLVTADGQVSQQGVARVKNALFAKAYNDKGLLSLMSEETNSNIRAVLGAMTNAAPAFANMNVKMENKTLAKNDVVSPIVESAKKLIALRDEGKPISTAIKEQSMFEGEGLSDSAKKILQFIDNNKYSGPKLYQLLKAISDGATAAGHPDQTTLFETKALTPDEIISNAIAKVEHEEPDLFESKQPASKPEPTRQQEEKAKPRETIKQEPKETQKGSNEKVPGADFTYAQELKAIENFNTEQKLKEKAKQYVDSVLKGITDPKKKVTALKGELATVQDANNRYAEIKRGVLERELRNAKDEVTAEANKKAFDEAVRLVKATGLDVTTDTKKMAEVLGDDVDEVFDAKDLQMLIFTYQEGDKPPDLTPVIKEVNGKPAFSVAFEGQKPKGYVPKKIGKAYKLMELWPKGTKIYKQVPKLDANGKQMLDKDGKPATRRVLDRIVEEDELHALFAGTQKPIEMGVWNDAKGYTSEEQIGKMAKGLAARYGWHMGIGVPATHHLMGFGDSLNPVMGYYSKTEAGHPKESRRVWVEVWFDATNDYTDIALMNPDPSEKDIRGLVPFGGFYMFQESNLSNWVIASSIMFVRIIEENERQEMLKTAGYNEELVWRVKVLEPKIRIYYEKHKRQAESGWSWKTESRTIYTKNRELTKTELAKAKFKAETGHEPVSVREKVWVEGKTLSESSMKNVLFKAQNGTNTKGKALTAEEWEAAKRSAKTGTEWKTKTVYKYVEGNALSEKQIENAKRQAESGWSWNSSTEDIKVKDAPLTQEQIEESRIKAERYAEILEENANIIKEMSTGDTVGYSRNTAEDIAEVRRKIMEEAIDNKEAMQFLRTEKGDIYGFVKDGKIYIDGRKVDPQTPVHEFTHVWDNIIKKTNPELWKQGKELLKKTPMWKSVMENPAYAEIHNDEDLVASEVHAMLVGQDGAKLLAQTAKTRKNIADALKKWLTKFWNNLKSAFAPWTKEEIDNLTLKEFNAMPLADLIKGTDMKKLQDGVQGTEDTSSGESVQYRVEDSNPINQATSTAIEEFGVKSEHGVIQSKERIEFNITSLKDSLARQYFREQMLARGFEEKDVADLQSLMDDIGQRIAEEGEGFLKFYNQLTKPLRRHTNSKQMLIPTVSTFKNNGEYVLNIDFGTLCTKRESMDKLLTILASEGLLDNAGPIQIEALKDVLKRHGYLTACDVCFVESKRVRILEDAQKWAYEWKSVLMAMGIDDDKTFIPLGDLTSAEQAKYERHLEPWQLDRLMEMASDDEEVFKKAYQKYMPIERRRTAEQKVSKTPDENGKHKVTSVALDTGITEDKMHTIAKLFVEDLNPNNGTDGTLINNFDPETLMTTKGVDALFGKYSKHTNIRNATSSMFGAATSKPLEGINPYDELSWQEVLDSLSDLTKALEALRNRNITLSDTYITEEQEEEIKKSMGMDKEAAENFKLFPVRNIYDIGGVRMQSFTDFNILLILDYIQAIASLQARRLPAHAYTKMADFVRFFGETGVMINMSFVPEMVEASKEIFANQKAIEDSLKADGIYVEQQKEKQQEAEEETDDSKKKKKATPKKEAWLYAGLKYENGHWVYAWAPESFPVEEAYRLRKRAEYGGRVGIIAVGVSDAHILKMLNDPDIDMVIPYHSSGMPPAVKAKTGLNHAKDYTDFQTTKGVPKGKTEYSYNKALQETGDPRKAAQKYLDDCEANGYTPKFAMFKDHPNYYKLLEDFRGYDNDNKPVLQRAVQLKLPKNFNELLHDKLGERKNVDQSLDDMMENKELLEEARSVLKYQRVDDPTQKTIVQRLKKLIGSNKVKMLNKKDFFKRVGELEEQIQGSAKSKEIMEIFRDSDNFVYGYAFRGEIGFNANLFNANTPAHEFAHIWVKVLRNTGAQDGSENALWEQGKKLLLDTEYSLTGDPEIDKDIKRLNYIKEEIQSDYFYQPIMNDRDALASEILARMIGLKNADFIQAFNDPRDKRFKGKLFAGSLQGKLADFFQKVWSKLKSMFHEYNETELKAVTLTDFLNMPLQKLWDPTDDNLFKKNLTSRDRKMKIYPEAEVETYKQQQLQIILDSNPMTDDHHTGIRSVDDILTAEQALDTQFEELYPDFTAEQAKEALRTGKVKVYSSHKIEQGTFVTVSKQLARDYAGGKEPVSKMAKIDDIAWIDSGEGQYAQVQRRGVPFRKPKYSASAEESIKRALEEVQQEIRSAFKGSVIEQLDDYDLKVTLKNGKKILVKIRDRIIANGSEQQRAKGAHNITEKNVNIAGSWEVVSQDGIDGVLEVSLHSERGAAFHEALHAAMDLSLNERERQALYKYFAKIAEEKKIDLEEAIADGYAAWAEARRAGRGTVFGKLWQKVQDLLHQLEAVLKRTENAHNVMRKLESGDVWENTSDNNLGKQGRSGKRYSAAGIKAKTANLKALKKAKEMMESGESRREILRKTGWYLGGDGRWRFEIPDNLDGINIEKLVSSRGGLKVKDIYDNPKLFEAYPQLGEIPIKAYDNRDWTAGFYDPSDNSISVGKHNITVIPDPAKITVGDKVYTVTHDANHNSIYRDPEDNVIPKESTEYQALEKIDFHDNIDKAIKQTRNDIAVSEYYDEKDKKEFDEKLSSGEWDQEIYDMFMEDVGVDAKNLRGVLKVLEEMKSDGVDVVRSAHIHKDSEAAVEEAQKTIVHELQHAIQHLEGFATGAAPEAVRQLIFNEIGRLQEVEAMHGSNQELTDKIKQLKKQLIGKAKDFDLYWNLHGEQEARLAEQKAKLAKDMALAEKIEVQDTQDILKDYIDDIPNWYRNDVREYARLNDLMGYGTTLKEEEKFHELENRIVKNDKAKAFVVALNQNEMKDVYKDALQTGEFASEMEDLILNGINLDDAVYIYNNNAHSASTKNPLKIGKEKTGTIAGAFINGERKGVVQTVKDWIDDKRKGFYKDWVDKNDMLNRVDEAAEIAAGTKLSNADRIYSKVQTLPATSAGLANALIEGGINSINAINKRLKSKVLPHKVTLAMALNKIDRKVMNGKHKDYLQKYGFNNWIDAFGAYLGAERLLEMSRLHALQYLEQLNAYNQRVIARDKWIRDGRRGPAPQQVVWEEWKAYKNKKARLHTQWKKAGGRGVDPAVVMQQQWLKTHKDEAEPLKTVGTKPEFTPYKLPNGLTEKQLQAFTRNVPEEFKEAADLYYKVNDNLLTILEDAGLISSETHKLLNTKYKKYCPLMRDFSDTSEADQFISGLSNGGQGIGNVSNPLKRIGIEGSERNVVNPLEATLKAIAVYCNRAERNKVAQDFIATTEKYKLDNLVAEVPTPNGGNATADAKNSIFTVMYDGKKYAYQTLPELYAPIVGYNAPAAGMVLGIARNAARLLRAGATTSPSFIVRNLIRDTIFAGISSENGFVPVLDTVRGMKALLTNPEMKAEFEAAGVTKFNFYGSQEEIIKSLDELAGGKAWRDKGPADIWKALMKYPAVASEFAESATRMGEYLKARERGASIDEAARAARELTLDFSRSGVVGQNINQYVPFFNAVIQGGDKLIRLFKNRPWQTMSAIGWYIILPSVILWALNHDEPWYEEIDPAIKNTCWCLPNGVRIPKPQEAGILFGTGVEAALDQAFKKDPKAVRNWISIFLENMVPGILPTVFLPIIEWKANYSFFRDSELVGKRLQGLPDEQQYTNGTSEFSKALGKFAGLSPVKLDNFFRGYTGTMGMFFIQAPDMAMAEKRSLPAKKLSEATFIRDFNVNDIHLNRSVNDFYELLDAASKQHAGYGKKGEPTPMVKAIKQAGEEISKLNKDIQAITVHRGLAPTQKRMRIDKLREKIRIIAKRTLIRYRRFFDV